MRANLLLPFLAVLAGCTAPALVPVPLPSAASGVRLTRQRVGLSCAGLIHAPVEKALDAYPPVVGTQCSFVSEAVVKNPDAAPRRVEIELHGRNASNVTARLGGREVTVPSSGDFREKRTIVLAPGEERTLTARGMVYPAEGYWDRLTVSALSTRHPVLAWGNGARELLFDVSPSLFSFDKERAPIAVRVEYPASWSLEMHGAPGRTPAPPRARDTRVAEHASARPAAIWGSLTPEATVIAGGPVLGLGLARAAGRDGVASWAPAAAMGYEIGAPEWVLASLLVDSDFDRRVVAALNLEVATPYVRLGSILFPSIAVGAGAPLRLADEPAMGIRGQATLSFPSVGMAAYVDWFPALDLAEPVLLLRASL